MFLIVAEGGYEVLPWLPWPGRPGSEMVSGRYQEDISTGRCMALPGSWRHEVREGVEESHASPWGTLAEGEDLVESVLWLGLSDGLETRRMEEM